MSLFEGFLVAPDVLEANGDRPLVDAMLRACAALARAQCAVGLVPEAVALSIIGTCRVELFDMARIVRDSARSASVAVPLRKALCETVGLFNPEAVAYVLLGTSNLDLVDTARALVAREVLAQVDADLSRALDDLLRLAREQAATPMLAHAAVLPLAAGTLGLLCADWAAPLVRGQARLRGAARDGLRVCLLAALSPQASMGPHGAEVARRVAEELRLAPPAEAGQRSGDEWVALACALGVLAGSLGRIGADLARLGQPEVGELVEPTQADDAQAEALPQRAASIVMQAAAQRSAQKVALLLGALAQEPTAQARLAGLAEWPQLLRAVHGSARALAQTLPALRFDAPRMRANLALALQRGDASAPPAEAALARHAAAQADALQAWRAG